MVGTALLVVPTGVVVAGAPARQAAVPEFEEIVGRVPHRVDPSTMPTIDVDDEVLEWNHELTGRGIEQIVLTLVENLELENQAVLRSDPELLEAVDHGDRLDAMRLRLSRATATGTTAVDHYLIENIEVVLLIPFGRQDGLSLGMRSQGTVTTASYGADGERTATATEPFATTFVMRRATGARWLNVDELPYDG